MTHNPSSVGKYRSIILGYKDFPAIVDGPFDTQDEAVQSIERWIGDTPTLGIERIIVKETGNW